MSARERRTRAAPGRRPLVEDARRARGHVADLVHRPRSAGWFFVPEKEAAASGSLHYSARHPPVTPKSGSRSLHPTFTSIMVRTRERARPIARRTTPASPSPHAASPDPTIREGAGIIRHRGCFAAAVPPSPTCPPRSLSRAHRFALVSFVQLTARLLPRFPPSRRLPPSASSPPPPPSSTRTSTSAAWWTSRLRRSPSTASRSVPSCSGSSSSS